ncbi:hypothetical protein [Frankia sp. AgKG'84/4]|uniref:hypothetical protein n=1 Tax=Frankia sp. AgKG'84/4 TaxID=573490 RepID=UPI00200EFE03|nr:hypothetical protein [Frankia sp. AgKG'84/4]MCL9797979.1 hypothetical protein [Frankia sp. AgKG'84/4]
MGRRPARDEAPGTAGPPAGAWRHARARVRQFQAAVTLRAVTLRAVILRAVILRAVTVSGQ